jgi:cell shape-determining protein MreC
MHHPGRVGTSMADAMTAKNRALIAKRAQLERYQAHLESLERENRELRALLASLTAPHPTSAA